jgi:hypothetical protein
MLTKNEPSIIRTTMGDGHGLISEYTSVCENEQAARLDVILGAEALQEEPD